MMRGRSCAGVGHQAGLTNTQIVTRSMARSTQDQIVYWNKAQASVSGSLFAPVFGVL